MSDMDCVSGKLRYPNRQDARNALAGVRARRRQHRQRRKCEGNYYPCEHCSGYHLTTLTDPIRRN